MITRLSTLTAFAFLTVASAFGDPAWHAVLPAGASNVLVIDDVRPACRAALGSERLRAILAPEGLRELKALPGAVDQADQSFGAVAGRIPRRITIAADSTLLADVGLLARAALSGALASQLDAGDERDALQTEASELLRRIETPGLYVRVEFDDAALPNQAMALVANVLAIPREGIEIDRDDDSIQATARLGSFVAPVMVRAVLPEFGVTDAIEDPNGEPIADHLADLTLTARLQTQGDAISLTLASEPTEEADTDRQEPEAELIPTEPGRLVYTHWDATEFADHFRELLAVWAEWEAQPAGEAVALLDEEDSIGDARNLLRLLERSGLRGAASLALDDGVRGTLRTFGHESTASLAETDLLRLVPANTTVLHATACDSMADWISDQLLEFEDRLDKQWLKAQSRGDERRIEFVDRLTAGYYENFAGLRKVVHEEGHQVFEAPVAAIVENRGAIEQLRVDYSSKGETISLVFDDAPCPEVAFVGKAKSVEAAHGFFRDAWTETLHGFNVGFDEPTTKTLDLGVAGPTLGFNLPTDGVFARDLAIEGGASIRPHVVVLGDWVILSTSSRLTREIVAAYNGAERTPSSLLAATGEDVVGYGTYAPKELAKAWKDSLTLFTGAFDSSEKRIRLTAGESGATPSNVAFDAFSDITVYVTRCLRSLDQFEWVCRQAGDTRQTDLVIKLTD